ncbi:unnamed protein product [Paramecium primaurelia]|uniref:Uncharacterized protein n=2 Tax=Paramecium TaxID=5884 RepID=A0A8S1SPW9_9CILI|nr:unnamed protein product [Paramecium primaurelia]CAD8141990.1 unnamed protein product [Paramecium pentaurelia]
MDKLSSKLDKFYTDFYKVENKKRNNTASNHIDLNTSLDEQFKDLDLIKCKDQCSDYED